MARKEGARRGGERCQQEWEEEEEEKKDREHFILNLRTCLPVKRHLGKEALKEGKAKLVVRTDGCRLQICWTYVCAFNKQKRIKMSRLTDLLDNVQWVGGNRLMVVRTEMPLTHLYIFICSACLCIKFRLFVLTTISGIEMTSRRRFRTVR